MGGLLNDRKQVESYRVVRRSRCSKIGTKEANINHEVMVISKIDKYAILAYEKLHGTTLNLRDESHIDEFTSADMWIYSFLCIDFLLAGRIKGFEKESNNNGSLLGEVQRLINIS